MGNIFEDLVVPPPPFESKRVESKPQVEIDGETGLVRLTPGVASATSGTLLRAKLELEAFQRAFQRVEGVYIHRCECLRCGYVWETLSQTPPSSCPTCHISWWFRPKDWKKMREGAQSLRLEANGSGQVSVVRGPGRPPGAKNKRHKLGRPRKHPRKEVVPHAGYNLAPGEIPESGPAEAFIVPPIALEEVAPAGGPQTVAGKVPSGRKSARPKDILHPSHGDYGALVSSVLGLSGDQSLESRQSADDGGRQDPDDQESDGGTVAGYDAPEISPEDQVVRRVEPSSVPRFSNTPAPIIPQAPPQEPKFKEEELAIRRITWEELHPQEAANQRAIAEAQAAASTVPSVPQPSVNVPAPIPSPNGPDPGLSRWADDPVPELPPDHFDDEDY